MGGSDYSADTRKSNACKAVSTASTIWAFGDLRALLGPRYEQGVNLAVVLQHLGGVHGNPLPPGVTVKEAGSKTLLGPKETKGKIILQASPAAPVCEKVPISVLGHVSINFVVKTAYASAPILVSVRLKPPVP